MTLGHCELAKVSAKTQIMTTNEADYLLLGERDKRQSICCANRALNAVGTPVWLPNSRDRLEKACDSITVCQCSLS